MGYVESQCKFCEVWLIVGMCVCAVVVILVCG